MVKLLRITGRRPEAADGQILGHQFCTAKKVCIDLPALFLASGLDKMDAIWSNNCQAVLIASDGVGLRHLKAVVHVDDGLEAKQDWLSPVSRTVQDKTRLVFRPVSRLL